MASTPPEPLTFADFTDCIVTGPMYGEVGYIGDIEELREYPCNCCYCRGEPPDSDDGSIEPGLTENTASLR